MESKTRDGANLIIAVAAVVAFSLLAVELGGAITDTLNVSYRYYSTFGALVCGLLVFGLALWRVPALQPQSVMQHRARVLLKVLFATTSLCAVVIAVFLFGGLSQSTFSRSPPIILWVLLFVNLGATVGGVGLWIRRLRSDRRWTIVESLILVGALVGLAASWFVMVQAASLWPIIR